jgi:putative ABC transport system ATP-binding protein
VSRSPRDTLAGVTLSIHSGEFVAVMGPSGCGKSTLLHVLAGLEPPDEGTVSLDGLDMYALDDSRRAALRRDRIGIVFQFFNLIPSLTAAENVALPLRLRPARQQPGREAIRQRVFTLMDQLDLHGLQGHGPDQISGGEQQRVAIARALAAAPTLLLADEPTGNLDFQTATEVMALLTRLCISEQQTTVLVTHDARTAAHADRVLIMRDGEVIDEVRLAHEAATTANGDAVGRSDIEPSTRRLVSRLVELGM